MSSSSVLARSPPRVYGAVAAGGRLELGVVGSEGLEVAVDDPLHLRVDGPLLRGGLLLPGGRRAAGMGRQAPPHGMQQDADFLAGQQVEHFRGPLKVCWQRLRGVQHARHLRGRPARVHARARSDAHLPRALAHADCQQRPPHGGALLEGAPMGPGDHQESLEQERVGIVGLHQGTVPVPGRVPRHALLILRGLRRLALRVLQVAHQQTGQLRGRSVGFSHALAFLDGAQAPVQDAPQHGRREVEPHPGESLGRSRRVAGRVWDGRFDQALGAAGPVDL
mmetsp:Transcript_24764/g.69363  ORF Transcript_24764/g.69363 Transcript_24764/m.69363 type:complete len:279 (+) Transcript_24764:91-927(+)